MRQRIFNRRNCLVAVLLLGSSALFSQVTIQDKISITPKPPVLIQSTTSSESHTLRFEGSWDVPIFARMYTSHCFGRFDTGTGSMTFEIPLTAGGYTFDFQPRVAELQPHQVCNVTLTLKVDGAIVMQRSASFVGGSLDIFALWPGDYPSYTPPYNTTFAFSVGDSIFYEEGWTPAIQGVDTCGPGLWDPASSVNLQIVGGGNLTQFYDYNTRLPQGASISGTVQQIEDNYELVADGTIPDSSGAVVTVQATSDGSTQTASVKIKPYYFRVTADEPRITYGDGTVMRIQMVDAYGNEHYRAATPSVRIRMADSLTYGTLWYGYSDSSRVLQMADTLNDIPSIVTMQSYSGVEARFYAIEKQPKDSVGVDIAVEKTGEGFMTDYYPPNAIPFPGRDTVRGATQVKVVVPVTKKLKIVNHAPWEIWPSLPASGAGESRGADRAGYIPKRPFIIKLTNGAGDPLASEEIAIGTTFEEKSGGHQHDSGTVILPPGIKQGIFYGQEDLGNPLFLTTDEFGMALVDSFVASQISGSYLVTAWLASDTTVKDTINLAVKVPGLVNFRDLIILDERPFVFSQTPRGTGNHPSNTWCTAQMGDSLFLAILDFYEWSRSEKGEGKAIQTSINDMSLLSGGLFDISADWNTEHASHSFHRVGLSVDVNKNGLNPDDIIFLTKFMKMRGGIRNSERPQIHFGFNGGN